MIVIGCGSGWLESVNGVEGTLELLFALLCCHLIGDYVLQSDFIAETKGENWYHLFVHCVLYCVPFAFVFGIDGILFFVFIYHFWIDTMKSHKVIPYWMDQTMHYFTLLIYIIPVILANGGIE